MLGTLYYAVSNFLREYVRGWNEIWGRGERERRVSASIKLYKLRWM